MNLQKLCFLGLIAVSVVGCGRADLPRGAISGTVTVGGQPLQSGRILFLPCDENKGPTVTLPIVNGTYTASKKDGPLIGFQRVEIEADPNLGFAIDDEEAFAKRGGAPLPMQWIPPQFNRQSQLKTEVLANTKNVFDVPIPAGTVSY